MGASYYCDNCNRYVKKRFLIIISTIERYGRLETVYCHRCIKPIAYRIKKEIDAKSVI